MPCAAHTLPNSPSNNNRQARTLVAEPTTTRNIRSNSIVNASQVSTLANAVSVVVVVGKADETTAATSGTAATAQTSHNTTLGSTVLRTLTTHHRCRARQSALVLMRW